jgi:hypothetical protein
MDWRASDRDRCSRLCLVAAACILLPLCCDNSRAEGVIQAILDSVRGDSGDGTTEDASPPATHSPKGHRATEYSDELDRSPFERMIWVGCDAAFYMVTSPFWLPCAALGDDYDGTLFFPRFPYGNIDGHLIDSSSAGPARFWSGRFNVEYLEPFTDVNGVGGRFLLSTTSRFGLDAAASHFDERRPNASPDSLWVGDFNLVFRFAQAEKAEFRTGLGFNWLHHPDPTQPQTDFGFNFTYGADFFPRKPWVFSAELDAGNIGRAGLFRFRTTGGILLRNVEAYTGYEYLDIGRGHFNFLLAGVRAWF